VGAGMARWEALALASVAFLRREDAVARFSASWITGTMRKFTTLDHLGIPLEMTTRLAACGPRARGRWLILCLARGNIAL